MASNRKPTVFLSHSSKNRAELIRLKQLLESKAVGAIEFFLASDEESIRLGTLWPQEIRSALDRAKLMFVFVSNDSLQSGWTYFEAGYGYCKLDRVIPLCLPGLDKGRVPPPFGLLQATNLHSSTDLDILLRTCNEVFGTKIPETFTRTEFEKIFSTPRLQIRPAVNWTEHIEKLVITIYARRGSGQKFIDLCAKQGFDCDESGMKDIWSPRVVSSGVVLTYKGVDLASMTDFIDGPSGQPEKPAKRAKKTTWYAFELAPELIEETFPLLDQWRIKSRAIGQCSIVLTFSDQVTKEPKPHQLSQRIYRSTVSLRLDGGFRFGNVDFNLGTPLPPDYNNSLSLRLEWADELSQLPIADLITTLFNLGVLIDTSRVVRKTKR